ncbi:MAG TPA: hypothetical protein PLR07_06170, partial [Promineifilum sp.]|nr:hypothetical protein [Promineifilum sp.]
PRPSIFDPPVAARSIKPCAFSGWACYYWPHMRSFLVALFVIVTWVVVATGAWADDRSPQVDDQPLIVQPPENWIGTEIKVTDLPLSPQAPDAAPAADQCSAATPLELSFRNTADGSGTLTNQPGGH